MKDSLYDLSTDSDPSITYFSSEIPVKIRNTSTEKAITPAINRVFPNNHFELKLYDPGALSYNISLLLFNGKKFE
jgi:hypothetical protein